MYRKLILSCFLLLGMLNVASATQFAYQVSFKDKAGSLTFSDSLSFLSSRSLQRRNVKGIALDSTDLPVSRAYLDSVLNITGGKLHIVSRWLNLCVILVNDSNNMHALAGKPFITSIKLVGYYATFLHKGTGSSATYAHKETGGAVFYGNTWAQTLMVKGNYLHDLGYMGRNKMIAVFDAGFAATNTHRGFDSLRNSGRISDVFNFTLNTTNVYAYDEHGTNVLSTMAGYVPDTFVGSAPLANYTLYVTEDGNSEQPIEMYNMLAASERADSVGVDVITTSLGYNTFDNSADNLNFATDCDGKSTVAAKAANIATEKGILFVASAGNEGGNSWNNILTPGDADSALTVGSVSTSGTTVSSSGFGPNAAGQVKPDVCGLGHYSAVFSMTGFDSRDGTSFSTPQIAGWAACLLQSAPLSTPFQLKEAIRKCADHYSTPGVQIGYGIPDFQCATANILELDTVFKQGEELKITVANPISNNLNISIISAKTENSNVQLIDVTGRTIFTFSIDLQSNRYAHLNQNTTILPSGIYILKVVTANQQKVVKLVKE